jgi:hypothetical protein
LLSVLLIVIGRPGTARAAASRWVYMFANVQTDNCLEDLGTPRLGLVALPCDSSDDRQWWLYYRDYIDSAGHDVGTLQNVATGQCLDDSAAHGLRMYQCDVNHDASRIFQQFKSTLHRPPDVTVMQNMATGSCVDDSPAGGLRGYFCNGTYYQDWIEYFWEQ